MSGIVNDLFNKISILDEKLMNQFVGPGRKKFVYKHRAFTVESKHQVAFSFFDCMDDITGNLIRRHHLFFIFLMLLAEACLAD